MKCKCLLELSDLLKETFALIWWHCLLHSYPLSHSSCKHLSFDLKPNQDKYNFISVFYKLTIMTENNVHFLIMTKVRKRLFPTFVQTLVWNMAFFFTVRYVWALSKLHVGGTFSFKFVWCKLSLRRKHKIDKSAALIFETLEYLLMHIMSNIIK